MPIPQCAKLLQSIFCGLVRRYLRVLAWDVEVRDGWHRNLAADRGVALRSLAHGRPVEVFHRGVPLLRRHGCNCCVWELFQVKILRLVRRDGLVTVQGAIHINTRITDATTLVLGLTNVSIGNDRNSSSLHRTSSQPIGLMAALPPHPRSFGLGIIALRLSGGVGAWLVAVEHAPILILHRLVCVWVYAILLSLLACLRSTSVGLFDRGLNGTAISISGVGRRRGRGRVMLLEAASGNGSCRSYNIPVVVPGLLLPIVEALRA